MILAHLAELHLGYRAYRRSERGRNVRERDVSAAFQAAIARLVEIGPSLVVMVGDVFDGPRPLPGAVVALTRGLEALRGALPRTPVLLVAGSRDTPLIPGDLGALAALDSFPHLEAATREVRTIRLRDLDIRVVLAPYAALLGARTRALRPDPAFRWNVLAAYGQIGPAPRANTIEALDWDYVALGGRHDFQEVAPGVVYAGALERVEAAPWEAAARPRGFATFDLASRHLAFQPLPGRRVLDLEPIEAQGLEAAELDGRVQEALHSAAGGTDGAIVRLRLRNASPKALEGLGGAALAEHRRRALHLCLEREEVPAREDGEGDGGARVSEPGPGPGHAAPGGGP